MQLLDSVRSSNGALLRADVAFVAHDVPALGYAVYRLLPLRTPAAAAKILTDQFRQELPADADARARALGRTIPEVVTIASLVEREAKADDERALMAGVYYNR